MGLRRCPTTKTAAYERRVGTDPMMSFLKSITARSSITAVAAAASTTALEAKRRFLGDVRPSR